MIHMPLAMRLLAGICVGIGLVSACSTKHDAADGGAATAAASPSGSTIVASTAPSAQASADPDAVSGASQREAEPSGPTVLGGGTVDGAALRKRHIERLKSDTSPVTLLKGESALELGKAICEA